MIIDRSIGGEMRQFSLLSPDDLMSITNDMPNANGEVIDVRGLEKWAKHPKGCERFLYLSARRQSPMLEASSIVKWGTMIDRMALALEIFGASISWDINAPKVEGVTNPPTGT